LKPSLHNRCEGRAFIGEKGFIGKNPVLEDGILPANMIAKNKAGVDVVVKRPRES